MKTVLSAFIFFSIQSFGVYSTLPAKIKGALLISPAELHGFELRVAQDGKCVSKQNSTFETINCELSDATAVFESKDEKSIVVLHRLMEMSYPGSEAGNVAKSFSLLGNWTGTVNGYTVHSPLLIALHEFVGKPGKYQGYIEFKDLSYSKITLEAQAE